MRNKKVAKVHNSIVGNLEVKKIKGGLVIEGFANKAIIDRGDDFIDPKAWDLKNYDKNPIILFNHNSDMVIGKALKVTPTDEGLKVQAKISSSKTEDITKIRDLIDEGMLKAFSVGFESKDEEKDASGINRITKAELFEISVVGVPMNQDSTFDIVSKSLKSKSKKELDMLKKESEAAIDKEEAKGGEELLKEAMTRIRAGEDEKTVMTELHATWHEMGKEDKEADKEDEEEEKSEHEDEEEEKAMPEDEEEKSEYEDEDEEEKAESEGDTEVEDEGDPLQKEMVLVEAGEGGDHQHTASIDENGNGRTVATSEGHDDHEHMVEAYAVQPGGEDDHIHPPLPGYKDQESEGVEDEPDVEEMALKDFQECVSGKIPALIDEGKDQDEAVAIAISMCQELGKCDIAPSRKEYEEFFVIADTYVKQAQDEEVDSTTTPLDMSPQDGGDTNPHLAAMQQTNILLGTLISEIRALSDKMGDNEKPTEAGKSQLKSKSKPTDGIESKEQVDSERKYLDSLDERLKKLGY